LEDRIKAIEFLVKVKGSSSMQVLSEALVDTAPEIRMAAIEGLASMKAYKAFPEILAGLKDPDPGVRQRAISAVALLGTSRNIRDLKPLTFDKNNAEVSAAAETAIQKLSATVKH
jgi:HEAT repeat protein